MRNYYIVNQHKDKHIQEKQGNYLWAPKLCKGVNAHKVWHYENMKLLNKGDIVFSNVEGMITSIIKVKNRYYNSDNPFDKNEYNTEGRKVDVTYYDIEKPFAYTDYIDTLLKLQASSKGAFTKAGRMNQGYLFPITDLQFNFLISLIPNPPKFILSEAKFDNIFATKVEDHTYANSYEENLDLTDFFEDEFYSEEELKQMNIHIKRMRGSIYNSESNNAERTSTCKKMRNTVLKRDSYLCQIDHNHETFLRADGKHQYLEVHHIIPMNADKELKEELDHPYNMISLCPICHRKVHHGLNTEKETIFWQIYNHNKKELNNAGFDKKRMEEIFCKYYFK